MRPAAAVRSNQLDARGLSSAAEAASCNQYSSTVVKTSVGIIVLTVAGGGERFK